MILTRLARLLACASGIALMATAPLVAARADDEPAPGRVTIEGQLFDASGRPLAGVHVTVHEKGTGSPFDALRRDLEVREVVRRPTDRHGLFRIDLQVPESSGRLLVRCYDRERWDHVRYAVPEEIDVTAEVRRRGRAVVTCKVDDAPVWKELAHRIDRVGGLTTERGRILREHGLPTETVTSEDGVVEWRYGAVTDVFRDDTLVRTVERPREAAGRTVR